MLKTILHGYNWRELWLPELSNNNASLEKSIFSGNYLAFSANARKGTTARGIWSPAQSANAEIDFGALYNGATKLWIAFNFILPTGYSIDNPTNWYAWSKWLGGNDRLLIYFEESVGGMRWWYYAAAATKFQCSSAEVVWVTGQRYHVLASMSDDGATQVNARLRIDGGVAVTAADATRTAAPAGGNILLNDHGAGLNQGGEIVVSDFMIGNGFDLNPVEEAEVAKGIPPTAKVSNMYPIDEGRGLTVYDRVGANNGTRGAATRWDFVGQPRLPLLSQNGLTSFVSSGAGIDISGDITIVWVGKIKSTYDDLVGNKMLFKFYIDVDNEVELVYLAAGDTISAYALGSGTGQQVDYAVKPSIDDYMVAIITLTVAGVLTLYINGTAVGSIAGVGAVSGAAATAYIGRNNIAALYDVSKTILLGIINGILPQGDAFELDRLIEV